MRSMSGCTIAYKSLGAGSFDYSFTLDNEFFSRFEGSEVTAGNCGVEVQLQRGDSMLTFDVRINGEVVVVCDRCLEDCSVTIDYEGRLIVKFSSEVEDYDGEILWLSPLESEVDLGQYIYESVILSLPYQRVHTEGECNEEMIRKFAVISSDDLSRIEQAAGPQGEEELGDDDASSFDSEETHGLSEADLAKLLALKEKMQG